MTCRRLLSLGASAALLAGLGLVAVPTASAITGGQPDGSGHPEVALILSTRGAPECSGVYVAATATQNVVLTDAHCLYSAGHLTGSRQVSFDPNWTASSLRMTGKYYIDPAFNPITYAHDIAVIDLDQDPAITPGTLAPIGTAPVGAIVNIVGYGQPYLGQRRVGTEVSTSLTADWLFLTARSANSCMGDSGGPDFLRGTHQVIALADLGTCATDQDIRVDTPTAQAFVAAAASWAADAPALTAGLSPADSPPGGQVQITGSTNAVFVGDQVSAQQLLGQAWSTVGVATVGSDGHFTISLTAAVPGTFEHRVVLPATRGHLTGVSAASSLQVLPVIATEPLQNGDLEAPTLAPWRGVGSVSLSPIASSGAAAVQVGRFRATNGDAILVQTFVSPTAALLTAQYQSHCADKVAYDWTTAALIDDTASTSMTVLPRTCARDNAWQATIPVPTVAGHTYTLIITTHDDGWPGDPTYALFDDVQLLPAS